MCITSDEREKWGERKSSETKPVLRSVYSFCENSHRSGGGGGLIEIAPFVGPSDYLFASVVIIRISLCVPRPCATARARNMMMYTFTIVRVRVLVGHGGRTSIIILLLLLLLCGRSLKKKKVIIIIIKWESSRENHLSPALDLNTFFIYLFFIPHLPASAIGNDF